MPIGADLIGLGISPEQVHLLGFEGAGRGLQTLVAVGTAQVGAVQIKKYNTFVQLTTAGGQTAAVLPSDAPLMVPYFVYVVNGGTTGLVFPPSGGKINAAAADASVNVAANLPRLFYRVTSTFWASLLAA